MEINYIIKDEINKLREDVIAPLDLPNVMNFWHGGDLSTIKNDISFRRGRFEYGPGLYLTTQYEVATKYSKGSKKLYLVSVEKGIELSETLINIDVIINFIKQYIIAGKRNEIISRISKYVKDDKISADIFNNVILNEDAIKPTSVNHLRQFYIDNGIDYNIINNAFGWGEDMMVLFNTNKIVRVVRVNPRDKISVFDLKQK